MAYSFVASGFGQVILLVTGPMLARMYGPSVRGELSLLLLLAGITGAITAFGVPAACAYLLARGTDSHALWPTVRKLSGFQVIIISSSYLFLSLFIFRARLPSSLLALFAYGLVPVAGLFINYCISWALGLGKLKQYDRFRTLPTISYGLSVLVAYLLHLGPSGYIVAWSVGQALASLVLLGRTRPAWRQGSTAIGPVQLATVFKLGRKTALAVTSPVDILPVDQLVIAAFLSNRALGLYAVALSFASVSRLAGVTLSGHVFSGVARSGPGQPAAVRRAIRQSATLLAAVSVLLAAVVPYVLPLAFGTAFESAVRPAVLLALAGGAAAARRLNADLLRAIERPSVASKFEVVAFSLQLVFALSLSQFFGLNGIAAGMLMAGVISWLLSTRRLLALTEQSPDARKMAG